MKKKKCINPLDKFVMHITYDQSIWTRCVLTWHIFFIYFLQNGNKVNSPTYIIKESSKYRA